MNTGYWLSHPWQAVARLRTAIHDHRHPEAPWFSPAAVRLLRRALNGGAGFEWGSGRSTKWLAQRLDSLVSVEHDPRWFSEVSRQLEDAKVSNVELLHVASEHPAESAHGVDFPVKPRYAAAIDGYADEAFDFIVVDGLYRQLCIASAVPKLKPGGLLLADDTHRLPLAQWGVPSSWPRVHHSSRGNGTTSIWRKAP